MKMISPFSSFRFALAAILAGLLLVAQPFSYSYSAWTSMTGAKTFAVSPFFQFAPVGADSEEMDAAMDGVVGYGFTDKVDLFVDVASLNLRSDAGNHTGSWIMPRYDLGGNNIVALQLGITEDDFGVQKFYGGPHYHFFWENDNWAMEANVAALFSTDTLNPGSVSFYSAPVYKLIPKILYPYIEFNPGYTLGDEGGFDFTIAPGFWLGIPDTPHQFSISAQIGGIKDNNINVGIAAWYWWSFSLGGGE